MASRRGSASHPISAPNFESNHIHRPRLVDRLLTANGARVALVVASAGYGKTTLLSDFNRLCPDPVCWLRLSEADRDLLSLAGLVWASLERRFYRLRGDFDVNRMDGLAPRAVGRRIAGALAEKVPERLAIVIEDLHLLGAEAPALKLVQALVDELPENVFLLLSSRRVPDLKLVELIAHDRVLTIGAEELAFDRPELHDLVEARLGEEPGEELLTALLNETGGWVTGVLLSERLLDPNALPLNGRAEPMSFEYLAENAFERVSHELQDFMLRTSILPHMTAPICDDLLERENSEEHLEELVSRGLFTSVTLNNPRTYEYHHALSQFLRTRAETHLPDGERSQLALRAGEILEAEGQEYTALKILLEAGHEEEAVSLANRYTRELFNWAPASALERVGKVLVRSSATAPNVFTRIAVATYKLDGKDGEISWLDLARQSRESLNPSDQLYLLGVESSLARRRGDRNSIVEALRSIKDLDHPEDAWRIIHVATAEADLSDIDGRWGDAISILESAKAQLLSLIDGTSPHQLELRIRESIAGFLTILANNYIRIGRQAEAAAELERALKFVDEKSSARTGSMLVNNLGCALHHMGELERALPFLQRAISISRDLEDPRHLAFAHSSMADFLSDLGISSAAAHHFKVAAMNVEQLDDVNLRTYIHGSARVLGYRFPSLELDWVDEADPEAAPQKISATGVLMDRILRFDLESVSALTLRRLESSLDDPVLNSIENTILSMWRVLLALRMGAEEEAQSLFAEALEYSMERNLVHIVAAYLRFEDQADQDLLVSSVEDRAVLKELDLRIKRIRMMSDHLAPTVSHSSGPRSIEIELLGRERLMIGSVEVALRPRHMEVLAFLLVNGPSSPDLLLETIWPDASPDRSSGRLHTAIYDIRRILGSDRVVRGNGAYTVHKDLITIDADRFESLAGQILEMERNSLPVEWILEEALELYRGPFLPSYDNAWVQPQRNSLLRLYELLLLIRANSALAAGQARQAIMTVDELLESDPLNDEAHMLKIRALGEVGHTGELVNHFRRSALLYQQELHVDLPKRIVETYKSITR